MDAFYVAFTPSFILESALGPVTGTITVSPDGRLVFFDPSSSLEYGTTYTATLESGTLSSSGQALAADFTWSFTTESPAEWGWSSPAWYDTGAPIIPNNHRWVSVDIDDAGNGCFVWVQAEGADFRLYASRSVEGGPWEDPVALQPAAVSSFSSSPLVGMDGTGQILAMWDVQGTLWFNWTSVTGSWGPPAQVLGPLGANIYLLKLFVDSIGNALLFYYTDPVGAQNDFVFAIRYDAALGWESPVSLGMRHATNPAFAGDRTGFAVVAWKPEASNPGITARRYLPGSGWTATETVDAPDADRPVVIPFVTTDGVGTAMAAWLKRYEGGQDFEIFTSRCSPVGSWTQSVTSPAASNLVNSTYPLAALSPDGSALVTWINGQDERCWASYQSASGTWGVPAPIDLGSANLSGSAGWPHFRVDGRVVVFGVEQIYLGPTDRPANFWVNTFDPATGWESAELLRTVENTPSWSVDRDADGRAALVWLEPDNANLSTIWWSRYR